MIHAEEHTNKENSLQPGGNQPENRKTVWVDQQSTKTKENSLQPGGNQPEPPPDDWPTFSNKNHTQTTRPKHGQEQVLR